MIHPFYDVATAISFIGLASRIALGTIFLVSGTGKVWDLPGTRQALSDFGVPDALTHQGSRVFPATELLVGLGLFFDATYQLAAAGAFALSLLFILGIANLLRQGRTPPCHCFGAVQSAPVGASTLTRAILLSLTSLACACTPPTILTPTGIAHVLSGGCALLVVSVTSNIGLWKKRHPQERSGRILDIGQRLPSLRLLDDQWLNDALSPQIRNLIVVTAPGCGPCKELKSHLDRWRKTVSGDLRILEIEAMNPQAKTVDPPTTDKRYLATTELSRLADSTPSALLVNSQGVLLSQVAIGLEQVEALLRVTLSES